jgi:4-hydroxy-tetrahydrodipicolinate synthase
MSRSNPFRGMGVALVTPFLEDGSLDVTSLKKLLHFHLDNGTDFLCILGTTAETPCLSIEEQNQIMSIAQNIIGGKMPLLLGFGGNNTNAIVERINKSDLSGWDGLLIVTPYYNKPSQEGLYQHYKTIANNTHLPIVLYNVPSRTGVNLEAATTLRIANECTNVVAVKEASGKLDQIHQIIEGAPEGFEVVSGDDGLTLDIINDGGVGVISVLGNVYPSEFKEMVHYALNKESEKATALHQKFSEMYKLLAVDGNPSGVKCFLAKRGMIKNILRLPLVSARKETEQKIADFVSNF